MGLSMVAGMVATRGAIPPNSAPIAEPMREALLIAIARPTTSKSDAFCQSVAKSAVIETGFNCQRRASFVLDSSRKLRDYPKRGETLALSLLRGNPMSDQTYIRATLALYVALAVSLVLVFC
jgi:hypothetical protein